MLNLQILIALAVLILSVCHGAVALAQEVKIASLNERQQSIITIAAFTANGQLDRLKVSLNEGVDAGLTINEAAEVIVQMYAYAGFPRSLNGLFTFMKVVDERKAAGIKDTIGRTASPLPKNMDKDAYGAEVRMRLAGLEELPSPRAWQKFCPVIDEFLKQHLFADIFARDVLTHQDRELATIAALASMSGTEGQLGFHFGAAMNTGWSEDQLQDFIKVLYFRVGHREAEVAKGVLMDVESRQR